MTGLVLSLALAVIAVQCGKKAGDDAASRSMVIVFVSGNVTIVPAGQTAGKAAQVGMIVREKDKIQTENGSVDLQTRSGSAIRVRSFTTISVASLAGTSGGDTNLKMDHGGILANVNKASSKESFAVVTPTAVAGVRGTKFSVDVQRGERPKVKVVEGKVAMSPRVAALDNYSKEEIESNPSLQKLADLQESEMILEENTEGSLDPVLEQQVIEVSEAIETAHSQNRSIEQVGQIEAVAELATTVDQKKETAVAREEAEFTMQEKVDHQTLIVIDPALMDKVMAKQSEDEGSVSPEVAQAITVNRKEKEEKVLNIIEEEARKEQLSSEDEIMKHYNRLEVIIMKNGQRMTGAVIAQTGDVMMVHTPNGIARVKKSDVEAQEFPQ
jgi:hypothetical protein